ncbi:hypothetical protein DAEQUDRAFT_674711, partial [Daedalea quercina L-15889]
IPLEVQPSLHITGAKFSVVTQKLAYKGIRETKMRKYSPRPRAVDNLIRAIDNVEVSPTEGQIWKSLSHNDFRREVRYFMWMAMHDAYMVGSNWLRPGYSEEMQARHECKHCGQIESMEHILSECEAPGQEQVWTLAHKLWSKKGGVWARPSLGAVLSCAQATFPGQNRNPTPGKRTSTEYSCQNPYTSSGDYGTRE